MVHGKVKDGLAGFLLCHRNRFKSDEPVPLSYGIINVGSGMEPETHGRKAEKDTDIKTRVWWFPHPPRSLRNVLWLEVIGPDGKNIPYHGTHIDWAAKLPVDKYSLLLRYRQFVGMVFPDLRKNFDLDKPGVYKVRWGYNPRFPGGPWTGELMSNEIQIEIVK